MAPLSPVGIPALPPKPSSNRYVPLPHPAVRSTGGAESSREPSDDDDQRSEGEDELVASLEHLTDPDEIKRVKR